VLTLLTGLPRIDPTANALRPKNSPSYTALAQIQINLGQKRDPLVRRNCRRTAWICNHG